MCAFANSTDDASTAAVRSSTAAIRRSAIAAAGSALTLTISRRAGLGEPIELPAQRVELAVGGDEPRAPVERQRGEEADHELVRARAEGDHAVAVAEHGGEAAAHAVGLFSARAHFSSARSAASSHASI